MPGGALPVVERCAVLQRSGDKGRTHRMRRITAGMAYRSGVLGAGLVSYRTARAVHAPASEREPLDPQQSVVTLADSFGSDLPTVGSDALQLLACQER